MKQTSATNANPVLSVDKNGCVLYSNEAGNSLLNEWGVKVGEKLPSSIVDIVQRVISRNSPEKIEVKAGIKVYLIVFHPLSEEEYVNISGFDITDCNQAEEKARWNEVRLVEAQRLAKVGSWEWDVVKDAIVWSEQMYKMFGRSPELQPPRFNEHPSYFTPESWGHLERSLKRALEFGESYELELEYIREDGVHGWQIARGEAVLDNAGYVIMLWGTVQDITERKHAEEALRESEEKYRIVADNTYDWEFWLGPDGRFLYISPSCERVTGYAVWEFMDKPDLLQEIVHSDDQQVFLQHQHDKLSSHHSDIEFRIVTKDGETRWIHHMCQPVYDIEGHYAGRRGSNRDITARKQMKETLAFERSQLLSIFDGMDDVVYVTDPYTFEVLYANKAMKEKFGGELIGGTCYREFQRKDSPCDFCSNQIILKEKGKPYHWEYYNPTVDRYFMIMDRIIKWPDGRDVRLEIAKDITDRREAEEALKKAHGNLEEKVRERTAELEEAYISLKESAEHLSEAQRIAHIGNYDYDLVTDKLYWSDELYRIFGLQPQEGMTFSKYLTFIHPDDRDYVSNAVIEAINGKHYAIDYRIVRPNGEVRIVHSEREAIFDKTNKPIRAKGTFQDVTEHKKSEQKIQNLANIVESSNDAIVTVSLDSIVTSWNKGAEQIFGYASEEILGKKVTILEPDNLRGEIKNIVEQVKQGKKIKHYESSRLKKDGNIIIISGTLSPVLDTAGRLVAISVIVRDITDIKRTKEIMAKIEIARKKEIHHRIKNNLQVISSLLDLQAEKFRDKRCVKESEVFKAFRESQDRVMSIALIHEELHEGRGTDTLNFSHYILELADNLLFTYRLGNECISLDTDIKKDIFFDMDTAVPLGMIINEIISNSLKYAFPGKDNGEIQIKLHIEECKNTSYVLSISDNGIGIPENIDIENIDSLGLQLVTTLVKQLDGEIELKRGNGTAFTIKFTVKNE